VTRHGPGGLFVAALARLVSYAWVEEDHIWYEMPLADGDRPRERLARGLVLEQVPSAHVDTRLAEIAPLTARERDRFKQEGARLWVVRDGERSAFACWTFSGRAPARAARHGWFEMPAGAVCTEGGVTSPHYRGRGVCPAALSTIGDRLADGGYASFVTKVAVDNAASRRAVAKAGFHEVGRTSFSRRGPMKRVEVRDATPFARELLDGLSRRLRVVTP
jgi:RimJ/RimL family protein N-acetyltransferase